MEDPTSCWMIAISVKITLVILAEQTPTTGQIPTAGISIRTAGAQTARVAHQSESRVTGCVATKESHGLSSCNNQLQALV